MRTSERERGDCGLRRRSTTRSVSVALVRRARTIADAVEKAWLTGAPGHAYHADQSLSAVRPSVSRLGCASGRPDRPDPYGYGQGRRATLRHTPTPSRLHNDRCELNIIIALYKI